MILLTKQVITALGKTWHPEHFTCTHCNQELGTRNFFEREGRPYCESDYHNLFSPRCAYCNGPILDVRIDFFEKTYPESKRQKSLKIPFWIDPKLLLANFVEMRDCSGEDLAHGALFLRPMWKTVRGGRIP